MHIGSHATPSANIGHGSFGPANPPASNQSSFARSGGQQLQAEALVDSVRTFFDGLGVKPSEGNDQAPVLYEPRFHNAGYFHDQDAIVIGVDPRTGDSFAEAPDVIAHEWAHRVVGHLTNNSLNLSAASEDTAVNESLADTFAAMYDNDDWVIGENLSQPIRDMSDPNRLGDPENVEQLLAAVRPGGALMHQVEDKFGNVGEVVDWHRAAGVPNKAAYLIGEALGRDKMGEIYLKAVREHLRPNQEIEGLALATLKSAAELFGKDSQESAATADAWKAVGVLDLLAKQGKVTLKD